jgi:hypothetical protein
VKTKKRVSAKLWAAVMKKFPTSTPLSSTAPPCAECENEAKVGFVETQSKLKEKLKEKRILGDLYDTVSNWIRCPLDQQVSLSRRLTQDFRFTLVPVSWLLSWAKYLDDMDEPTPSSITVSLAICRSHKLSVFDPSVDDRFAQTFYPVPSKDAHVLRSTYGYDSTLAAELTFTDNADGLCFIAMTSLSPSLSLSPYPLLDFDQ